MSSRTFKEIASAAVVVPSTRRDRFINSIFRNERFPNYCRVSHSALQSECGNHRPQECYCTQLSCKRRKAVAEQPG